eukprot:m.2971 g.2971  ORF g.2971 m.2971 type:complete len:122 (+) comp2211_c0_seq2:62-427(+)
MLFDKQTKRTLNYATNKHIGVHVRQGKKEIEAARDREKTRKNERAAQTEKQQKQREMQGKHAEDNGRKDRSTKQAEKPSHPLGSYMRTESAAYVYLRLLSRPAEQQLNTRRKHSVPSTEQM